MSKIYLENITKKYNEKEVLKSFDFKSNNNEFVVIVGPSGCGKTTLLRLISGLEDLTSGNIIINNKNVNEVEPKYREVSMVFQNYALYPTMNVYENIAFPLTVNKVSKDIINENVLKMAKKLEIEDLLDRLPKNLSGGEKQRVAIGRAMIKNPKIYLFDEPLSNLDALIRDKMRTELKRLHKKTNATFLYVTHDQNEAMSLGDRIIVMRAGKIQQIDTPSNIYKNPKNLFVAEFIGSPKINIIKSKEMYEWLLNDTKYQKNFIYTIRPEDISIVKTDITSSGKIILREILGKEVRYHIQYKKEKIIVCDIITDEKELLNENDYVKCFCKNNKISIFNKLTEERVII